MYKVLIIISTIIVLIIGIAAAAMVWVKDASTNPSYCALCHKDPYYSTWESGGELASRHAQAGIPCQTCHPRTLSDSIQEIAAQVTGNYDPLIMELAPLEACTKCHEHESYDEIIPLTAGFGEDKGNPHDSHFGKVECNICHLMHRDSVDYCSKCHDPLVGGIKPYWRVVTEE